ncbi:mechanosensitive ion channel family protein [cf. Phormidesmis sp. LEGE 11477]|uniref:mechanosensitive ion channel family protein n=1 Tax=cf. Phormidesmis sp. LEGE 11477 TaxID=1828680 RepID=UPI0018808F69|nr:mechanosensitive ion channel family protein [cf. Phormidesmis sp. LEGE 11477]MBE9063392.1 mechanosensitive ion channel family protein [cf. Phormidesmis sp. LEGE 11477]
MSYFLSKVKPKISSKALSFGLIGLIVVLIALTAGDIAPSAAQSEAQPAPAVPENAQPVTPDEAVPTETSPTEAPPTEAPAINRLLPTFPLEWQPSILSDAATEAIAPVYLDGRTVFYLSATTVAGPEAAELRAQEIQKRLNALARDQLDSSSPSVAVVSDQPTGLPVIEVGGEPFLTVTTLDAQIIGLASPDEYANTLANTLESAFLRYRQERQPAYLRRQLILSLVVGAIAFLIQMFIRRAIGRIRQRQRSLSTANTRLGKATSMGRPPLIPYPTAEVFESVFELLKARLDNRQKRKINETIRALLTVSQYLLWLLVGLWILARFPYTRWLTTLLLHWLELPGRIFLAAGVAYVLLRASSFLIDKVGFALQEGAQWAPESSQRLKLRFQTFSQVTKGLVGAVIFSVLLIMVLAIAGIEVGPILAGAGIAGVGISLAAQSVIKDVINGLLILFEDQFGVGDVVSIQGLTGSVERLNLRITQLRDLEGRLITIPNSQISIVENLSKDWSQVDLMIQVAPTVDLDRVFSLLKETASAIATDPKWQQFVLEPPDLLGVESVDHTGISIRLLLKTQPSKQFLVARELRARIKEAFDQAEIALGVPQRKLEVAWEKPEGEDSGAQGQLFADTQTKTERAKIEQSKTEQTEIEQIKIEQSKSDYHGF